MPKSKKGKQKAQPQAQGREEAEEDIGGGHLGTILEDSESHAAPGGWPSPGDEWHEDHGAWNVAQGPWSPAEDHGELPESWNEATTSAGQQWPSSGNQSPATNVYRGWGHDVRQTDATPAASVFPPVQREVQQPRQAPAQGASWQSWGAEAASQGFKLPRSRQAQAEHQSRVAFVNTPTIISNQDMDAQMRQAIQASLYSGQMNGNMQTPAHPPGKQGKKQKRETRPSSMDQTWGYGASTPLSQDQWGQQDQEWTGDNDLEGGAWDDWEGEREDGGRSDGGWNDLQGRQQFAETLANASVPSHPMPSRTMAYASHHSPDALNSLKPGMASARTGMDSFVNMRFAESHGEGIKLAERAFFGRERKAKDRMHWQFPYDKDPRVKTLMEWIEEVSPGLGAFGLNKFLQTRERGALVVNAAYRTDTDYTEPPFDWLSYESAVDTRDKIIQESIGFYDPAMQVIVFVFLPSKTRNSIAMWRRKITVPNSVRLAHVREIELAKAALRKDYPVFVDELPDSAITGSPPKPSKKKKKNGFWRRVFKPFRIVW